MVTYSHYRAGEPPSVRKNDLECLLPYTEFHRILARLLTSDRFGPWVMLMENKDVRARAGSTPMARRKFLSASAVTAAAVPLISGTALTGTAFASVRQVPDPGL